jgi:diguanylate cyclase (GGDEF)-like protein/PAS domain S-box-containing protein
VRVLEELSDQMRAVGTFWLTDPATGELVCRQASGPFGETVRGWRLQPGQGIAGWVAQYGEGLVVADILTDPRHFTEIDQHIGMQPRSTLCVPLKRKNLVIGVLQLLDTAVGRFGAADLELVEALAATGTIAIENARLYEALRQGEARYRLLAENATDVIWTVGLNMQITYVSPSVTRLLGFTVEEAMARTMQQAYTPATFEKAMQMFAEEMALERAGRGDPKRSRTLELELYRKDGGTVPVEAHFGFLSDATGQPIGILAIVRDITERKRAEDTLRALSLTDDLTGLYNRRGFLMFAEQQFRMAKRAQRAMVLLFADIDDLKKINDTWGHAEGDRALIEAAALLKNTFREADIIARLSGDEFAAIPLETKSGALEAVTARLQTNLAILNAEEKRRYALSLSIGVATFDPEHPCTTEELLAIADAAMYEQKQRKRNGATNDAR